MQRWITIDHITSEIFLLEGIWVVLESGDGEEVNGDDGVLTDVHYDLWSRGAPGKMSVAHWRRRRFSKILPEMKARVFMSDGSEVVDHTTLAALRALPLHAYQPPDWPESRPIYFRYDCPEPDVAYRLNEELQAEEYSSHAKIDKGWFFKSNLVVGGIGETRIYPWEFEAWKEKMHQRANRFSSAFSASTSFMP